MSKKFLTYSIAVLVFLILLFSFGSYITGDYDKQNKIMAPCKKTEKDKQHTMTG